MWIWEFSSNKSPPLLYEQHESILYNRKLCSAVCFNGLVDVPIRYGSLLPEYGPLNITLHCL